eukprot:scaffold34628_cov166-Amphora_coffeaeformis.AAC.7
MSAHITTVLAYLTLTDAIVGCRLTEGEKRTRHDGSLTPSFRKAKNQTKRSHTFASLSPSLVVVVQFHTI